MVPLWVPRVCGSEIENEKSGSPGQHRFQFYPGFYIVTAVCNELGHI